MSASGALERRAIRRAVHHRSGHDGHLLPAELPGAPPKRENMRFFPTAAAAQAAGFRACKRCRPDAAPGSPEWDRGPTSSARALRLIADGIVDREGVDGLANRLGYSRRQLQRQLTAVLGAGPVAVARAQRAQAARVLLETTDLSMSDVAFAAGFGSIRQFNDTVREVFATPPSALRAAAKDRSPSTPGTVTVRLAFRHPLWPDSLFGHLAATAVPGVEEWRDGAYRRTMRLPFGSGIVALSPQRDHVSCRLTLTDMRDFSTAIARCRRLLDLDADPVAVDAALAKDPALRPLIKASPGRRVPRTVDEHELALRVVLGQQISTLAARTHAGRLVVASGEPIDDPNGGLTHLFPAAAAIAELDPETLAMPGSRRRTFIALAQALADGKVDLGVGADGRSPSNAFPSSPASGLGHAPPSRCAPSAIRMPFSRAIWAFGSRRRTASSRRLRRHSPSAPGGGGRGAAYAVQYLWGTGDHAINHLPVSDTRPGAA